MTEDAAKIIRNCFENLEKAEVLSTLLREKFMNNKDADVCLIMINSCVKEASNKLLELQGTLQTLEQSV